MKNSRMFNWHVFKTALQTALQQHSETVFRLITLIIGLFLKTKKAVTLLLSKVSALYPGRESNPYSLNGHRILSPACLPVPPPRLERKKLSVNSYWLPVFFLITNNK